MTKKGEMKGKENRTRNIYTDNGQERKRKKKEFKSRTGRPKEEKEE